MLRRVWCLLRQGPTWTALTAVRLVVHRSIGIYVLADGEARLRRARRAWEYDVARRQLVHRRPADDGILSAITNDDEYGMVDVELSPSDVVIDVGAHIGAFSLLCRRRGSRSILAFEPNPESFARLTANMTSVTGVRVDRRALFRSDRCPTSMLLSGTDAENTGASTLLFDGYRCAAAAMREIARETTVATTVSLDAILALFPRVRLLKLDCEGSEFPILLTSRELRRIDEIVGEYHEVAESDMGELAASARVAGFDSFRVEHLVERLAQEGFRVTFESTSERQGIFHATRLRMSD